MRDFRPSFAADFNKGASVTRAVASAALGAIVLQGCLPSSQRGRTNSLLPSDSLSRRVAAVAPVDSLDRAWTSAGARMELPTSIAWLPGPDPIAGRLVVSDTRAGALRVFDARNGSAMDVQGPEGGLAFPYLAGVAGDTVVVLLRGDDRLAWLRVDERSISVARSMPIPAGATAALVTDAGVWAKRADESGAWLARLDGTGHESTRYPLSGPSWRRIGFLRPYGDSVLSLSGYRPVVDVLAPAAPAGRAPDTLALVGFDSPQLVRSHRYIRGEVDQPPLLTSSAVAFEDRLYVLNLRGDHIRIDVYGFGGRLERALAFAGSEAQTHFPVDIAVRRRDGVLHVALVMQSPGGVLSEPDGYVLMLRGRATAPPPAAAVE